MTHRPADPAAWIRAVLDEHETALLRYALRLTGDLDTARDVVQETFLRLCRAEPGAILDHVGPWLFRVCRQRAVDLKRKEQRMPASATPAIAACESQDRGPAETAELVEDGHDMLRHLAMLSANQQEVVRLKFSGGLSYREISEVTGLTVTNVGFLLHTALAKLRGILVDSDAQRVNGESNGGAPLTPTPSPARGEGQ